MKRLLLIAMLAGLSSPALAADNGVTGNVLMKHCNNTNLSSPNWYFCSGMMIGVADAAQTCLPPAIPSTQLRAVVMKYISRMPQRWHQNGAKLVLEAFNDAWPCQSTPASTPKPTGKVTS
jgi:hypothetical protein